MDPASAGNSTGWVRPTGRDGKRLSSEVVAESMQIESSTYYKLIGTASGALGGFAEILQEHSWKQIPVKKKTAFYDAIKHETQRMSKREDFTDMIQCVEDKRKLEHIAYKAWQRGRDRARKQQQKSGGTSNT